MILALDPGLQTGWARSDGACGTHTVDAADLGALCCAWNRWLASMLIAHQPSAVVIERAFGRSGFTAELPIILVGIAHMTCHRHCVPRHELTASAVKKLVTGSGRATKREVGIAVGLDGWIPDSPHAADAAAVLMAYRNRMVRERTA